MPIELTTMADIMMHWMRVYPQRHARNSANRKTHDVDRLKNGPNRARKAVIRAVPSCSYPVGIYVQGTDRRAG